jgi:hypothetical protein
MLNNSSSVSGDSCYTVVASVNDYYGSDTAEVVKVIASIHQPGQVKWRGGVVWRAIPLCNNVALLVGQRVRIVDRIQDSLLLIVKPIVLAPSLDEHFSGSHMPSSDWAEQHKRKKQLFRAS